MDTRLLYDRPSRRLRKVIAEGVTVSVITRKKYIPQLKGVYKMVLKVITTCGKEGWIDP